MIEVKNLTKVYGSVYALDDVSFSVGKGEILGFLGPNGAGKSTAMKIITTYVAPSNGQVSVDGMDINTFPIEVRRKIGYLPENAPLYREMNIIDYLKFVGHAREMDEARLKERLEYVIEATGLETELRKDIGELSKGFRQRVGLAQAIIHDPEVLILDEPTTGLDPLQIIDIRNLISSLAKQKTVIFSTHILQEVAAITERVLIIDEGHVVADGFLDELSSLAAAYQTVFLTAIAPKQELENELKAIPQVSVKFLDRDVVIDKPSFKITGPMKTDIKEEVSKIAYKHNYQVITLYDRVFSLEEIFISLIKKSKTGKTSQVLGSKG